MGKNTIDNVIQTLFTDLKLYNALLAKARRMLTNDAESEDIVNEAYIKLFEELKQDKEIANKAGFLWNTVYRQSIDVLRKNQSKLEYISHCKAVKSPMQTCVAMKRFEQGEEWKHWVKRLSLSKEELLLFDYIRQEYTNQEIAQVLGTQADDIRKRRFSLKRKFQKLLKSA